MEFVPATCSFGGASFWLRGMRQVLMYTRPAVESKAVVVALNQIDAARRGVLSPLA